MELLEGCDFLRYVRPAGLVEGRLRDALRQLAAGVQALHGAGKLHRDLKPSNVRVSPESRVVILDFGLAADLDSTGQHLSMEPHLAGTIAYMALEQAAHRPVTSASDWYAVGVILFQALTGRLPFQGSALSILQAKQDRDPPVPQSLAPSAPADLGELCTALISRDPERRPPGAEIRRRLGEIAPSTMGARFGSFVGRSEELKTLASAFDDIRPSEPAVVLLHGRSGIGKSALAQHFLDGLPPGAVTLTGRCYEHEAVPYKALDGVVDSLGRYLRRLPDAEARALLPREVALLARVWPVLREVHAVAGAPPRGEMPDPRELRRRAFAGLRELLARLGDRVPLVLFIDDLQWGDADSAAVLVELLRPPEPPVLLLLACYRTEDADTLCPQALARAEGVPGRRVLSLEGLSFPEACDLAARLLQEAGGESKHTPAIAREAGGSPFFVHELTRFAGGPRTGETAAGQPSLDAVLWARVTALSEPLRRLLEVVAGVPHLLNPPARPV